MSVKVVCNSSPLIYLARLGKLELLRKLFGEVIIPKEVFNEVIVEGKKGGYSDVIAIEKAVEKGWLKVKKAQRKLEEDVPELDKGEVEVICLAMETKAGLVLMDDASARSVSEALGLNTKGTVYVLLKAYKKGLFTKKETGALLARLIQIGFRLSPEVYSSILESL